MAEKILEGHPGKRKPQVLDIQPGEDTPVLEYPEELAYYPSRVSGKPTAQDIWERTAEFLKTTGCLHMIHPTLIEYYSIVLDEKLMHGGNPVLRWMFENVYIETDAAGGMKPSKKKSSEKIDGAVATVMSVYRAVKRERKPSGGAVVINLLDNTYTKDGETKPIPPSKNDLSVRPRDRYPD